MALLPCGSVETEALLALPLDKVTALPKATPLVLNWTVPVGVPVPVTVAVKVTAVPGNAGFAEEVKAVDDGPGATMKLSKSTVIVPPPLLIEV